MENIEKTTKKDKFLETLETYIYSDMQKKLFEELKKIVQETNMEFEIIPFKGAGAAGFCKKDKIIINLNLIRNAPFLLVIHVILHEIGHSYQYDNPEFKNINEMFNKENIDEFFEDYLYCDKKAESFSIEKQKEIYKNCNINFKNISTINLENENIVKELKSFLQIQHNNYKKFKENNQNITFVDFVEQTLKK